MFSIEFDYRVSKYFCTVGTIQIGGLKFRSQSAAKSHVREIRDRYQIGQIVANAADDTFLRDLLLLHSEKDEKIGCGIDFFKIELDQEWKTTKCFVIYRLDETFTDFSFLNCIDGPDHKNDIWQAMRHAIYPQIILFKKREFGKGHSIFCPYLEVELLESNCHVDHVTPSFNELSRSWLDA